MSTESTGLASQAATSLLETIGSTLWGFKPNLMHHFVDQNGPWKSVVWFATNMPKYETILKEWGPIRTHLLATVISTLNGCFYCEHGHALAFQLHYLKTTGEIFPIDEIEMFSFHKLGPTKVVERFVEALEEASLRNEIEPLRRMFELYTEGADASLTDGTTDIDDPKYLQLISMFASLNACGIQSAAAVDEIHDPINRDVDLRNRYTQLRTSQAKE